jgi:hypothetical protein
MDCRFEHEELTITTSRTGSSAVIAWQGISDSRSPGTALIPALQRIAESVLGAEVTVDLTQLEYMNSATVAPLLGLIKSLDDGNKPVLVLFSDADWQRTHLNCMTTVALTLRNVRVESRAASLRK